MEKTKKRLFNRILSLVLALAMVLPGVLSPLTVKAAEQTLPQVAPGEGVVISVEKYTDGKGEYLLEPVRIDLSGNQKSGAINKAFRESGLQEVEIVEKELPVAYLTYIDSLAGIKGDEPVDDMNNPQFGPHCWLAAFNNNLDAWKYGNSSPWREKNSAIRIVYTENRGVDAGGISGSISDNGTFKVSKDDLLRQIADARALNRADLAKAIKEAETVALNGAADQPAVDAAVKALDAAMKAEPKPEADEVIPEVEAGKGYIVSVESYAGGEGTSLLDPVRVNLRGSRADAIKNAFADCGKTAEIVEKKTIPDFPYIDSINGIKGSEPVPGDYVMNDPKFGPKKWMVSFANNMDPWNYLNWKKGSENNVIRVVYTENNGDDMGGVKSNNSFKVDKDALARTIADARALKNKDLATAIADAKAVLLNGKADQPAVDEAVKALNKAVESAKPAEKPEQIIPDAKKGEGFIFSIEDYSDGNGKYIVNPVRVEVGYSGGPQTTDAKLNQVLAAVGLGDIKVVKAMDDVNYTEYIASIGDLITDASKVDNSFGDKGGDLISDKHWEVAFNSKFGASVFNSSRNGWSYDEGHKNGVVRAMYTVNNGTDIGATNRNSHMLTVNKDALVRNIADARALKNEELKPIIKEAEELALSTSATQEAVDAKAAAITDKIAEVTGPKLEKLKISGSSSRAMKVGEKLTFKATTTPADFNTELVWQLAEGSEFASIDAKTGELTAKAGGVVSVIVVAPKFNVRSMPVTVTITNPATYLDIIKEDSDGIPESVTNQTIKMNKKTSIQLGYFVDPIDTTDKVVWDMLEGEDLAEVDQNGKVTAFEAGTAKVRATAGNVSAVVTIEILDIPATGIKLDQETVTVKELDTVTVKATVEPGDSTDSVIWKSEDKHIATVKDGVITGVATGETTVTATAGKFSAKVKVVVTDGPHVYFEYADGRDPQRVDPKTNTITLKSTDIGKFKVSEYEKDDTLMFDCTHAQAPDPFFNGVDGHIPKQDRYLIKGNGDYDPYMTGEYNASVVFAEMSKVLNFKLNVIPSGITEIRVLVNGKVVSMDDPYLVEGPVSGTHQAKLSVEGRVSKDDEFVKLPINAIHFEGGNEGIRIDKFTKYDAYTCALKVKNGSLSFKALTEEQVKNPIRVDERYDVQADFKVEVITAEEFAKRAEDVINKLPEKITLDDKAAVEEAQKAYDALTDKQKELVNKDVVAKLTEAAAEIKALEKAKADKAEADKVTAMIEEAVKDVTLDSREALKAARDAYEALTADQKAFVSADTLDLLTAADRKVEDLQAMADKKAADEKAAAEAAKAIEEALKNVSLENRNAIAAARKAYDALTADQKALVNADLVAKLAAAEKEVAELLTDARAKLNVKFTSDKDSVKLTWKKIPGAKGYEVFRYDTKTKKYRAIARLSAGKTSYTVKRLDGSKGKKLSAGKTYKFAVRSYEVVNGKKVYNKTEKITAATKPVKAVITGLKKVSSRKMKLTWKKIKDVSGYQVYMKSSKKGAYKLVKDLKAGKAARYTVAGKKNKTYTFKVRAYKLADGKKVYGAFSKEKKLKLK